MDLTNLSELKNYLRQHNLWLKKSLGQRFLIDRNVLEQIVKAAELKATDFVLEIGPGLGVLTQDLAKKAKLVLAIEKDRKLCELIRERFRNRKNVKIVCDDILLYSLDHLSGPYKLVANLPYAITSPVIRKFLEHKNGPELLVLMVQKEVGERITALPGDSNRSILTVMVEFYGQAKIICNVPADNFFPKPAVDSTVLKIIPHPTTLDLPPKTFFNIVKAGFAAKRRQIKNSLSGGLNLKQDQVRVILKKAGIKETLRAEDLTLEDWFALAKVFIKAFQDS